MFTGPTNKTILKVAGAALAINGLAILAAYLSVAPFGTNLLMGIAPFGALSLLAAVLGIPVAIVLLFWLRYRVVAFKALLICAVYACTGIANIRVSHDIRHNGFVALAHRSRPLIAAIEQFETKYGKPPDDLAQLVPEILPAVPGTGMGATPDYEYITAPESSAYEDNPWVLKVNTPNGLVNWDVFLYFPKQNYPSVGFGGVLEPIEDWAYVHE